MEVSRHQTNLGKGDKIIEDIEVLLGAMELVGAREGWAVAKGPRKRRRHRTVAAVDDNQETGDRSTTSPTRQYLRRTPSDTEILGEGARAVLLSKPLERHERRCRNVSLAQRLLN